MRRKGSPSPLKLEAVTFGEREPHLAFAEALKPYFAKVEVWPPETPELRASPESPNSEKTRSKRTETGRMKSKRR